MTERKFEERPKRDGLVRLQTGIPGLDEMIEGGFPFPSVVLLSGSAGTGKTTFCLKYLCEGAKKGEQGLYFTTLSEPTQWMLRYASQFDFINKDYFGDQIRYMDLGPMMREMDANQLLAAMEEKIAEVMPQRIVIDPITVVGGMLRGDYRLFLFDLFNRLKNWNATTLVTGEVNPGELDPGRGFLCCRRDNIGHAVRGSGSSTKISRSAQDARHQSSDREAVHRYHPNRRDRGPQSPFLITISAIPIEKAAIAMTSVGMRTRLDTSFEIHPEKASLFKVAMAVAKRAVSAAIEGLTLPMNANVDTDATSAAEDISPPSAAK